MKSRRIPDEAITLSKTVCCHENYGKLNKQVEEQLVYDFESKIRRYCPLPFRSLSRRSQDLFMEKLLEAPQHLQFSIAGCILDN